jgi:hypothetical protein
MRGEDKLLVDVLLASKVALVSGHVTASAQFAPSLPPAASCPIFTFSPSSPLSRAPGLQGSQRPHLDTWYKASIRTVFVLER